MNEEIEIKEKLMRAGKTLWCAIALAVLVASGARADEWNKVTYLTFGSPVQLPGVTLPAGTYTFKLADTWSNRHVVQVFDKEQSKIYGTFLTVSDQKLDPSDKPVVMFEESPAGTPNAVRAWFYPGDTVGDEFVYPKNQAVEIAKATHKPVMATDEDMASRDAEKMKNAKVGHVDENGNMSEDNQDNRANNEENAAANRPTDAQSPAATAGTSGTTGSYTAAPRESDHRTGIAQNGDTMNRYGRPGAAASAGNRTTNPSMAPGGETVTSSSQQTGAKGASNQSNEQSRDRNPSNEQSRSKTAVGTSGQTGTTAAPGTTSAQSDPNSRRNSGRRLPKTASPLGLFFALSGLSIGAGLSLRGLRRRYFADAR